MRLRLRGRSRRFAPDDAVVVRLLILGTVLVGIAAIASHEEFTAQALLAAAAAIAGFGISYHRRRAGNGWLKLIIAVLVLAVARDFFNSLVSNPYDPRVPLVRLFLWLQALHSFDLPARKDLKYSLASAVVLMAVAGVYARDPGFGLFLVPFVVLASGALVAMAAHPETETPLRVHRVPPRVLVAASMTLSLLVVMAGMVTFAAIPRGEGFRVRWLPVSPRLAYRVPLYGRILNPAYPEAGEQRAQIPPVFNPQGYVGFSTDVDLRLRGILDDTVVLRVRATRPAFWRGLAFDEYTGLSWRMGDRSVEEFSSPEPRIVPRYSADEPWPAGSEQVIQTFYVEALQPNVIFGAYRATEVYFPAGGIGVDRYAGLRSPVPLEAGVIYSVISRVPNPPPAVLQRKDALIPEAIRARYLQLPPIPQRVHDLANDVTRGASSPYQRAVAINRFLVNRFRYNLQAPPLPAGADAVDHFLFETGEGSCEAFASAMAVLLRAAGVPARLVTGYTTGSYHVLTGYYEVRNSDAHAWVEAFIPRVGWIEFEPTPGFMAPEETTAHARGQWLMRDAWLAAVRWFRRDVLPGLALGWTSADAGSRADLLWGSVAVLLIGLIAVRARPQWTDAGTGIVSVYARMLRALARLGISRPAATTPREFVDRVPDTVRQEVTVITEAFELARYSPHKPSPDGEAQTWHALVQLERGLRGRRSTLGSTESTKSTRSTESS